MHPEANPISLSAGTSLNNLLKRPSNLTKSLSNKLLKNPAKFRRTIPSLKNSKLQERHL
jgi:hypothetical protein